MKNKVLQITMTGVVLGIFILSHVSFAEQTMTWDECLLVATTHHPDLVSAKEGVRQSEDTKKITASGLWPQADVSASITASSSKSSLGTRSHGTDYAYGVSGSQLLFDGFQNINHVNAAKEDIKASQWNFQFVSSQVRLRLRTAFINLLKAQKQVDLSEEIKTLRTKNLALIELRYKSGTEHKGALLTAQANLAQAEFEVNQAKRVLEVFQRNLVKELGAKLQAVTVEGDFDISQKYTESPDFEKLADANPQLLRLNAQKNAADYDVKAAKGNWWPSLSVAAGAAQSDDQWPPKAGSADVGLRLSWPILEGGSRFAEQDRAKSIARDLTAQQQSLKDALAVNLAQNWVNLQDAIEQVEVQKKFLSAVEERSRIAQQQYAMGLITYDNWTIIEDNLVSSKKQFLNTQANALLSEANWIQAQGRTLEYEN